MAVVFALINLSISIFYFKLTILNALIISVDSFLFTFLYYYLSVFQASLKSKKFVLTESIFFVFWFLISAVFIYFSITKFWIGFIAMFISLVVIFAINFKKKEFIFTIYSLKTLKEKKSSELKLFLSFGFPISIWLFISNVFSYADRFFMEHFFGYAEAGVYATTYDLFFRIGNFVCMPILLSNHTRIVNAFNKNNNADAKNYIKKSIKLEFAIMILTLIGVLIIGKYLFELVTKIKLTNFYLTAIPILLASFIWQIAMFVHKTLELGNRQMQMIFALLISFGFNIISNIIFIPKYAMIAASINTFGSTLIYVSIVFYFSVKYNQIENNNLKGCN
jgi:O-antigen/teichoic acid export membrane protein